MTIILETEPPESIVYKRGIVCVTLTGFHAIQYRSMIWKYGKAEATERFWWLWHKRKEPDYPQKRTSGNLQ